jgi:hypothetical protein
MKRMAAFTLLEITLAMLLSCILAVMAYGIFNGFQRVALGAFGLGRELDELRTAQRAIAFDMDRCAHVVASESGFVCLVPGGEVRYDQREGYLLRGTPEVLDTLCTALAVLRWHLCAGSIDDNGARQLVDKVYLTLRTGGDSTCVVVQKHYDVFAWRAQF